jgi:hypothetical protein
LLLKGSHRLLKEKVSQRLNPVSKKRCSLGNTSFTDNSDNENFQNFTIGGFYSALRQKLANKGDSGETETSFASNIQLRLLTSRIFSPVKVRDVPQTTRFYALADLPSLSACPLPTL